MIEETQKDFSLFDLRRAVYQALQGKDKLSGPQDLLLIVGDLLPGYLPMKERLNYLRRCMISVGWIEKTVIEGGCRMKIWQPKDKKEDAATAEGI